MRILFIGDVVGKIGRRMIRDYLPDIVKKNNIDFVIANGENATHGKGLIRNHYFELIDSGVDVVTLGNHYDNKSDLRRYIDGVDRLIRPLNLLHDYPGEGSIVFDVDGISIRVTNILGTAMMPEEVNNPYYSIIDLLSDPDAEQANIHIVDFHAEATGEKICFAHALDGKVSAVLGTHTHVQTKDARILEGGTAFISDVGMTGFADGALGFDIDTVTNKIIYGNKAVFALPEKGRGLLSAVVMEFDNYSGKCEEIHPIYFIEEKNEN
ncbi:MAG: TIGR00282 family metallophosphoesterase [Bacilli bacterium]|nr:TIGR00282 family metallophosphoesterase [Bacilli bacterium]